MKRRITLDEFIIENQGGIDDAGGEFSDLLRHIGIAGKIINRIVNKAGLMDILGVDGQVNATGDTVQKLDIYANDLMIEYLQKSGVCAGVASEELEEFVAFESRQNRSHKYVVMMDPLDGSSNIDVNISVGTIFGIYKRVTGKGNELEIRDFLQTGRNLVAAGYILYGTSTMFVYSTGKGVNGFTYDRGIGEFCLSHPDMRIPDQGKIYSINQGYYRQFNPGMQNYVNDCADQHMMLRYIGSMVADVHRTLCLGGIFIYPSTSKSPEGKLRMLYECNPMGYVIEQAGGMCVNEAGLPVLEIPIQKLHQRSPVLIGSKANVQKALSFLSSI
ncbi:MAG: class 1 fructose-bisphosphatase [Saprospiraceae bacterium]|nr:class 1 fructose-bisphosphatase [Saprospiraceae bacterium]